MGEISCIVECGWDGAERELGSRMCVVAVFEVVCVQDCGRKWLGSWRPERSWWERENHGGGLAVVSFLYLKHDCSTSTLSGRSQKKNGDRGWYFQAVQQH